MSSTEAARPERRIELVRLRAKYERMMALRVLHDRARTEPSFVEPDPRGEMASLAEEFPGVLREIDELPLDLIRQRIESLGRATSDPSLVESWMIAQLEFHRLARGALAAKRWLGRSRSVSDEVETRFIAALTELPRGADARAWSGRLAAVAAPPRGRLMDVVHARVAAELGISEREARVLVFGASRRER